MAPTKTQIQFVSKYSTKTTTNSETQANQQNNPVEVFCRLRSQTVRKSSSCISLTSPTELLLTPPDETKNRKAVQYAFNYIFTEHANQKEVFDHIAMPLLEGLLAGENGLLFSYGVTGSGKTHTMTGSANDPGIIPRSINMLFNTISKYQTPKFVIKSDKMNGFEVQSEAEAQAELFNELKYKKRAKKHTHEHSLLYCNDGFKLPHFDENASYSIFISYVEIYNNIAYDLLDESGNVRSLQAKILREDCNHNIYVNGIVELEIKSSDEALELYSIGKKRKRIAQTSLNAESSRSHSIFTIRLVIMSNKNHLKVAQLSLVDLAGSERASRSQTSGQRLKEASAINNSLMSLRNCLEVLRENQKNGQNRIVPYRDSRLTHLFRQYFEGEGQVKMIICVNPSLNDYDETVHVLKFAELTREVKLTRSEAKTPKPTRIDDQRFVLKTPRTRVEATPRIRAEPTAYSYQPVLTSVYVQTDQDQFKQRRPGQFPRLTSFDPESNEIKTLILYLKRRKQHGKNVNIIRNMTDTFRMKLVNLQKSKSYYEEQVKCILPSERLKIKDLTNQLIDLGVNNDKIHEECDKRDKEIENLRQTIEEKNFKLRQNKLEREKQKQKLTEVNEKMTHELDKKLRRQREYMETTMNSKLEKLELVKDILSDNPTSTAHLENLKHQSSVHVENMKSTSTPQVDYIETASSCIGFADVDKENIDEDLEYAGEESETKRSYNVPIANRRYHRSRSSDGRWLKHTQTHPVPLGTVLQPVIRCNKSVTKLTKFKDVVSPNQSKYVLIAQEHDQEGDLETKLYKGDIIPTTCGGAQVIFDDVERLRQESPLNNTFRKRTNSSKSFDENKKFKK